MGTYHEVSDPRYRYLKAFQCERLARTYADFAQRKEYQAVSRFFFTRIYSTEDSTDRDRAFKRVHKTLKHVLPRDWLHGLAELIDLQRLTVELDQRLLERLESMAAPVEFGMDVYEEAYVLSNNFADRMRQIELLTLSLTRIHDVAHTFGVGFILRTAKRACVVLGETRLVDFLLDGYGAFSGLKDIQPFVAAVADRETRRLERIYSVA